MEMSASTLAPEIGGVKLSCASNPMRVLNRLLAPAPDLGDDGVLDHSRRQAGRSEVAGAVVLCRAVLDHVHRHVIAIELAAFLGRGRGHGRAGVGEDQALQRRGRLHAAVAGPRVAVGPAECFPGAQIQLP